MEELGGAYRLGAWYEYGSMVIKMARCMRRLSTLGKLKMACEQEFGSERNAK